MGDQTYTSVGAVRIAKWCSGVRRATGSELPVVIPVATQMPDGTVLTVIFKADQPAQMPLLKRRW